MHAYVVEGDADGHADKHRMGAYVHEGARYGARMLASRRRLAALAAAGLLAAPAPALGQSAGDEQYEDPFAGEDQQEQPAPDPDTPVDDGGGTATPEPEPVPATAGQEPAATGQEPAAGETATASQEQLPNTGADAGAVLLAGTILLAGGVALRLRLRERA
jgi:LPXTG-motif cell wall-anchored protein